MASRSTGRVIVDRRAGAAAAAIFAVTAFLVPDRVGTARASASAPDAAHAWVAFDPERIQREVAAGRTVFVDITAEWCVTCQVNKQLVTYRGAVAERLFGGGNVMPMQGDWTRPAPAIGAYLESFGRYGIPFNLVYGPGAASRCPRS